MHYLHSHNLNRTCYLGIDLNAAHFITQLVYFFWGLLIAFGENQKAEDDINRGRTQVLLCYEIEI